MNRWGWGLGIGPIPNPQSPLVRDELVRKYLNKN